MVPGHLFRKIVSALRDDPEASKAQLGQCRKLAICLLSHKREQEVLIIQTKDTRARLYLDPKRCFENSWEFYHLEVSDVNKMGD